MSQLLGSQLAGTPEAQVTTHLRGMPPGAKESRLKFKMQHVENDTNVIVRGHLGTLKGPQLEQKDRSRKSPSGFGLQRLLSLAKSEGLPLGAERRRRHTA